jgi:hypothetical protein
MNKAEIQSEITRLEDRRAALEREMFRVDELQQALETVLENWQDGEDGGDEGSFRPKRGRILKKTFAVVSESSGKMSTLDVLLALRKKGVRSTGNQKNFAVTVSKSLRRLVELGRIAEDRSSPNRVFYMAKPEEKQP